MIAFTTDTAVPTPADIPLPGPEPGLSVWVVEDNAMLRETIVDLIHQTPGIRCTFSAGSSEEAIAALERDLVPQVVLMDLGLPGMSGQEGIRHIKAYSPATQVTSPSGPMSSAWSTVSSR